MPAPIVTPFLFNVHALPAHPSLAHLQPGNHLRLAHHPLLGLPDAPFIVRRARFENIERFATRRDAVWVDSEERVLTPPFTLRPGNPVTAYIALASGETCIWAQINADPSSGSVSGEERPGTIVRPIPAPRPTTPLTPLSPSPLNVNIRDRVNLDPRERFNPGPPLDTPASGMRVEAYVDSLNGPAFSAARLEPRFAFAAPGIVELRMSGRGTVTGLLWLETRDLERVQFAPWRALNLPHEGGPRYVSLSGARGLAENRVHEAAPKRMPLQETLGTADPAAAPAHTPPDELDRVRSLSVEIEQDLDALIHDLSADERALEVAQTLRDETGRDLGSLTVRRLTRVLQATLDPGVAEYLGYMTLDRDFDKLDDAVVFYLVDGYFRPKAPEREDPDEPSDTQRAFDELVQALPGSAQLVTPEEVVHQLETDLGDVEAGELEGGLIDAFRKIDGPVWRIGCVAVADLGAPPLPPPAPRIDGHEDKGWLPAPLDAPRRQIEVDVSSGLVAGLMAAEKNDPAGRPPRSLNAANGDGYHLPLTLSLETDESGEVRNPAPGQGFIGDTGAGPDQIRYSIAQQDRFGRWSEWTRATVDAGVRPAPPQPVFQAYYEMPAIAEPMPAGTVLVRVLVPEIESLPPGGEPVQTFRLVVQDLTSSGTSVITEEVSDPLNPPALPDVLEFSFAAPLLAPTEMRRLRLVATWRDTAGRTSIDSQPVNLKVRDPRPPAQLTVPNTLLYSARPDVQGRALIEYRWSPLPGQDKVAVYYTDENRLTAFLEAEALGDAATQTVLDAVRAAANAPARAAQFRLNAHMFKAFLFERLDVTPASAPGGRLCFQHYVSGSLRILSFYRLSAETDSAARVPLETLPIISYGIPNSDPPAKPILDVRPDPRSAPAYAALAQVRVVPGVTEPVRMRLRRSSLSGNNPFQMPLVGESAITPEMEDGFLVSEMVDVGPLLIAPDAGLKPWVSYFWVAEVQGAPEPGSTVAGRWSLPSDPVSLAFTPPGPPAPAASAEALGRFVPPDHYEDVELVFDHPETLNGGAFGDYVLRVYRRRPGEAQVQLAEHRMSGGGPFSVPGMNTSDPADQASVGTIWRLVLIDPLGRASTPFDISSVTPRMET